MEKQIYSEKANILKALTDINRLQIIDMLSCGERCACELLEKFNITQPTLSHHMKVLIDNNLVKARKDKNWIYYSLNQEKINEIVEFIKYISDDKNDCICHKN